MNNNFANMDNSAMSFNSPSVHQAESIYDHNTVDPPKNPWSKFARYQAATAHGPKKTYTSRHDVNMPGMWHGDDAKKMRGSKLDLGPQVKFRGASYLDACEHPTTRLFRPRFKAIDMSKTRNRSKAKSKSEAKAISKPRIRRRHVDRKAPKDIVQRPIASLITLPKDVKELICVHLLSNPTCSRRRPSKEESDDRNSDSNTDPLVALMCTHSLLLKPALKIMYTSYTFKVFDIWGAHTLLHTMTPFAITRLVSLEIGDVNPSYELLRGSNKVAAPLPLISWPAERSAFTVLYKFPALKRVVVKINISRPPPVVHEFMERIMTEAPWLPALDSFIFRWTARGALEEDRNRNIKTDAIEVIKRRGPERRKFLDYLARKRMGMLE